MLSKGKQITLGIFTVIGLSVLATLSLGEIGFIDTIELPFGSGILFQACFVLYFALFVLCAALAKKKNLEALAKTTIIFGSVLAAEYLLMILLPLFGNDALSDAFGDIFYLFYPAFFLINPLTCIRGCGATEYICGTLFVVAQIVAGIVYTLTKKPAENTEAEIQEKVS